jgi:O-antigen ligase
MKLNYQNVFFNKIPFYLTFLIPIFLVSGPFLSDLAITICAIIFLINSYKNNLIYYYKNIFFYIFISFYIYLNISALISNNILFSLKTSLPYLRFGIFVLSTWYLLNTNNKLLKYFFFSLLFTFLFLELDGIYQFIFKYNLFNYPLVDPYRVSSLFGNELILGSFLSRNYPLFFGLFLFLIEKKKLSKRITLVSYIILILLPILIFMSGERSSFFYFCLALIYILLFFPKRNIVIIFLFSLFLIITGILLDKTISKDVKRFSDRIINQTLSQLKYKLEDTRRLNIFSITHEEHYRSAFRIFKDHIIFGAGPKSFRLKCSEQKYLVSNYSCVSHPHNTYVQLLSETGIIGFLFVFLTFMTLCGISFKMFYNKYFLSSYISPLKICLFASFLITLWPLVPSGNFFTNWLNIIYYLPVGFFLWTFHKKS